MNQFSPQFAIISKLKKIVTKTSTMLKGDKTAGITEAIARKIQKGAYEAEFRKDKESKTPPYLTIAEQLQSNDSQIYRASVYALRNIAKNEEKSKDAIFLPRRSDRRNHTIWRVFAALWCRGSRNRPRGPESLPRAHPRSRHARSECRHPRG